MCVSTLDSAWNSSPPIKLACYIVCKINGQQLKRNSVGKFDKTVGQCFVEINITRRMYVCSGIVLWAVNIQSFAGQV